MRRGREFQIRGALRTRDRNDIVSRSAEYIAGEKRMSIERGSHERTLINKTTELGERDYISSIIQI